MKIITISLLVLAAALSGCASSKFNRTYANSTLATDDIGYGSPKSPHSF